MIEGTFAGDVFEAVLYLSRGIPVVLSVAGSAWLVAAVLGLPIYLLSQARWTPARWISTGMVLVFRGIPELVLLFIFFYGMTNIVRVSAFLAAVLALSIVQGPFFSEVYRAAFRTVAANQRFAAMSIGLSPYDTFRLITLPQAVRFALVPMGNILLALTKTAALTSTIGIPEVTKLGMTVMENSLNLFPATLAICLVYLAITLPLSQALRLLSRYLRGSRIYG